MSKAVIRFRDGTQAVFNRAVQFEHGCGAFIALHFADRELTFLEHEVVSTELIGEQRTIGFKREE